VVLTIGGNDLGFSDVIKACLVPVPGRNVDCETTLEEKFQYLRTYPNDLSAIVWKVYDGIFDRLKGDTHYQVYHILYPRFFNYDTEWCNEQSLGIFPGYKPKLTKDLREKLNLMADTLNEKLADIANAYVDSKQPPNVPDVDWPAGWQQNRLWTLDPNLIDYHFEQFYKHRFCEPGVEDPKFYDDSIWFFSPFANDAIQMAGASYLANINAKTCQQDPKYIDKRNSAFAWDCDVAKYFASPGAQQDLTVATGVGQDKWFHPKTVGFTQLKKMLVRVILDKRPQQSTLCEGTQAGMNKNATAIFLEQDDSSDPCLGDQTPLYSTTASSASVPSPPPATTLASISVPCPVSSNFNPSGL